MFRIDVGRFSNEKTAVGVFDHNRPKRRHSAPYPGTEGPVLEILAQDQNDKEDSSNCRGQKEPTSTSVSQRVSLNSFVGY